MILAASILLTVGVLAFVVFVRDRDLPESQPVAPTRYLDERQAVLYDSLRDLNFEYRLGKLSEADYHTTKLTLEEELARVLADVERLAAGPVVASESGPEIMAGAGARVCPHCGARFQQALKFCGECGKPMAEGRG